MATEQETLSGFFIKDAAVVDRNTFIFTAHANPEHERWAKTKQKDLPCRLMSYDLANDFWGSMDYNPSMVVYAAGGMREDGGKQAMFAGLRKNVASFNYGVGTSGEEGLLDPRASIRDLRFIDGHYFGIGGNGFIGRRDAPGQWTYLQLSETRSPSNPVYTHFDGYGSEDLYLIEGRKPAVLHWNGTEIVEYPFPKEVLEEEGVPAFIPRCILAAPSGLVYIASSDGRLLAGRAPTGFLPFIPDADPRQDILGMCWFKDKPWAIMGGGLAVLEDMSWEKKDVSSNPESPVAFRFIDSRDDVLLVAGENTAAVYDGSKWTRLFGISHDEFLEIKALEKTRGIMTELVESAKKLREVNRRQP